MSNDVEVSAIEMQSNRPKGLPPALQSKLALVE
jgi:hypothetical protein